MEFVCGRFQFFDLGFEYPDPGEPIIDIPAAISSGYTSGAADREIDFPSTLIKFLGNLRAEWWDLRRLVKACRNYYVLGFVVLLACTYGISVADLFYAEHFDSAEH